MHVAPVRRVALLAFYLAAATTLSAAGARASKPSLTVSALPSIGFAPVRLVFTAELKGEDSEDMYCPTVEWIWGDDTKSVSTFDCDPYVPGKSEIRRRFVMEKTFNLDGEWRVELRLKQKDRVVARGMTTVKIQP